MLTIKIRDNIPIISKTVLTSGIQSGSNVFLATEGVFNSGKCAIVGYEGTPSCEVVAVSEFSSSGFVAEKISGSYQEGTPVKFTDYNWFRITKDGSGVYSGRIKGLNNPDGLRVESLSAGDYSVSYGYRKEGNLLLNGDFENNISNWTITSGSGFLSVLRYNGNSGLGVLINGSAIIEQTVSIESGKWHILSGYHRVSGTGWAGGEIYYYLSGNISGVNNLQGKIFGAYENNWESGYLSGLGTGSSATVRFSIPDFSGFYVFLDNLSLETIHSSTSWQAGGLSFSLNDNGEVINGYCTYDDVLMEAGFDSSNFAINTKLVDGYIRAGYDLINFALKSQLVGTPVNPIPYYIREANILYAAGRLLLREYGAEYQGSNKDGQIKIDQAMKIIEKIKKGELTETTAEGGQFTYLPNSNSPRAFTREQVF